MKTLKLIAACALFVALAGCPPISPTSTPPSIPATGSAIEQTKAHVESADSEVKSSIAHADAVGAALLNQATKEHASALSKLGDASMQLAKVQADFQALAKAADQQKRDDAAKVKKLQDENTALLKSWGHRLQVTVTWGLRIFIILALFHAAGSVVAPFLPAPFNMIVGVAAKVINPFGWFTWLGTAIGAKKAAQAAAAANSLTINLGTNLAGEVQSGIAGSKAAPLMPGK